MAFIPAYVRGAIKTPTTPMTQQKLVTAVQGYNPPVAVSAAANAASIAPKPTTPYTAPNTTVNTAALQAALAATPAAQAQAAPIWGAPEQQALDAQRAAERQAVAAPVVAAPTTTITPYTPQAYSVNLPTIDWSFNPTQDMRTGWNTQASATAGQEIDPQLLAIKQALDSYMTQGQNTRNELNPRYTNQSLAIANVIQNSVKQDAINNAIRRGADTSGWLPDALIQAGNLEVAQRGNVESNRNIDLNALSALEAQQTDAAGEQNVGLEKLRGQRITTALADLQNQAQANDLTTKQNQWSSALGGEQLRASNYGANESNRLSVYNTQVGANQSESQRAMEAAIADAQNKLGYYNTDAQTAISAADRELQASVAANEQANTEWGQANTVSQQNYGQQQDALSASLRGVSSGSKAVATPDYLIPGSPDWLRFNQYNTDVANANKTPYKSAYDIAIENAIQANMLKELSLNPDGTPINKAVKIPTLY